MKIYDVVVEQEDLHQTTSREKHYQVVGKDIQQAIYCAGQRFNEVSEWYTTHLKVISMDKKESYETSFPAWTE